MQGIHKGSLGEQPARTVTGLKHSSYSLCEVITRPTQRDSVAKGHSGKETKRPGFPGDTSASVHGQDRNPHLSSRLCLTSAGTSMLDGSLGAMCD